MWGRHEKMPQNNRQTSNTEHRRGSSPLTNSRARASGTLGSGEASATPARADHVIVLDGDDGEDNEAASVVMWTRKVGSKSSSTSLDRRAVVVESSGSVGSERTVEGAAKSDSEPWIDSTDGTEEQDEARVVQENSGRENDAHGASCAGAQKEAHKAQEVLLPSATCVARRTRSQVGIEKLARVSYATYFEDIVDDSEDDDAVHRVSEDNEDEEDEEDESYRENTKNAEASDTETTATTRAIGKKRKGFLEEDEEFEIRKFLGIDVLVSLGKERIKEREGLVSSGSIGIAQRTCSQFSSKPKNERRKKLGTVSNPYCMDADEMDKNSDSESSSSDWEEGKYGGCSRVKNNGNINKMGIDEREEGKFVKRKMVAMKEGKFAKRKPMATKKSRMKAPKADEHYRLLLDTILNNRNKLPEELVSPTNECSAQDMPFASPEEELPWIFEFGYDGPILVEKTEEDKILDELWADFDFAMGATNMGSCPSNEGHTKDVHGAEDDVDPSIFCYMGKHHFILDEKIGIMCRFCRFVKLEIRYVIPNFGTSIAEMSGKTRFTTEASHSIFNDICEAGKNDGKQGTCHLPDGTVWDLIPEIGEDLYEHQREAFEFMWRNLAGSIYLDALKPHTIPEDAGGCIISHAPGTGKTRLTIVFIQTYMKIFPECRPVIVAPCGMLMTWEKEFKKWNVNLGFHVLNSMEYSGKEDETILKLAEKEPRTKTIVHLVKLGSWFKGNSILGISYGLYKKLTIESCEKDERISNILMEEPGLFVLDEGHTPRNERSLIWKTLEKVKTRQRIILSGTPFQNNFRELYNTLCLVRPKFAENISAKMAKICQKRKAHMLSDNVHNILPKKNELKGKWAYLTTKISDDSLEELRSMLRPFVHVCHGKILDRLPGLSDCVILLEPLPQQKSILEKLEEIESNTYFENEYKISLVSIHPSLLTCCGLTEKEESVIDKDLLKNMRLNANVGVKTRFVMELVRLCAALKEKVLVFCQFIEPLSMMRDQLVKVFNWSEGKEVLQMDGKIPLKHRQSSIDTFNDLTSEARVLLASTKACSEGINLTGASRVVLLDVVWNPSVERQAVSRAYRIGQKKVVYTYHLISGKAERQKYDKQTRKEYLSKLVFSKGMGINAVKNSPAQSEEDQFSKLISGDRVLEEMTGHNKIKDMFLEIYYPLKKCPM